MGGDPFCEEERRMFYLSFVVATSVIWAGLFIMCTFTVAAMLRGAVPVSAVLLLFLVFGAGLLILLFFRLRTWWRYILGMDEETSAE